MDFSFLFFFYLMNIFFTYFTYKPVSPLLSSPSLPPTPIYHPPHHSSSFLHLHSRWIMLPMGLNKAWNIKLR